jgi:hypothetical protein
MPVVMEKVLPMSPVHLFTYVPGLYTLWQRGNEGDFA